MPALEALPSLLPPDSVLPPEAHPQPPVIPTEPHPPQPVIPTEAQRSGGTCFSPTVISSGDPTQQSPTAEPSASRSRPKLVTTFPTKSPKIPTSELRVKDTHRLIASRYSDSGTVLSRLSSNPDTLGKLLELDDATNDRFLGEEGLLPGIGIHELVYGIRYAHIVNAAFTHASPVGGRFNTPTRGAWYASLERNTSVAEVAFHKLRHLQEIDWPQEEISTSDDYLADITSSFHDLRLSTPESGAPLMTVPSSWVGSSGEISGQPISPASTNPFSRYLVPEPIPECYARPQRLAERLLARRSNGIVYPSVRHPGGTCLAVFRPALVYNVRRGARLELRLQASNSFRPSDAIEVSVPK